MDKTVEILVVVVVALIAATIIIFLLTDQTDSFGEFIGGQTADVECDVYQSRCDYDGFNEAGCSGWESDQCESGEGSTACSSYNTYTNCEDASHCEPEGSPGNFECVER